MQVLLLYTKSIAFAPENSEELALGYGNRSALLLHVHKYEECNIDIDKALSISKSDDLKAKLFSRKATCFKLIAESSYDFNAFEKIDLPKISKSEKVPCVAKNLTLNNNEKYGKHFVTNKEINPGEIIALEEAYISFPLMSKLYLVCSYCLAQSWNGIPCKFCTESIYCSESCKSKAWEEYHEIECYIITNISPLSQVSNPQSQQIYRAALRLFIKTVKSHTIEGVVKDVKKHDFEIFNGIFSCHQFQSIYNLATNGPTEDSSNKRSFVKTVMKFLSKNNNIFTDKVKSYFESEKKMLTFVEQLLSRLISIIDINSYQVEDYRNKCNCKNHNHKIATCGMRGLILVPCCSLFNHNCVPNVEWFFGKNNRIIFISNRRIFKGEQLFINYEESLEKPSSERKLTLKKKFQFTCDCQACIENWLPPTEDGQVEEKQKIREIINEHGNFCKKKGLENLVLEDPEKWDFSKESLSEMINLIDLCYKKLKGYNAFASSAIYKDHMLKTFYKLYGLEWEKMDDC